MPKKVHTEAEIISALKQCEARTRSLTYVRSWWSAKARFMCGRSSTRVSVCRSCTNCAGCVKRTVGPSGSQPI
jgi:hypothetical protein